MRDILQKAWFSKQKWVWFLAPFTALFFLISKLRVKLYKHGILKQLSADIPVIIVGNIGIGGNGKTPVVIALTQYLVNTGFNVVVLSRGYGGSQQKFPHLVSKQDSASVVGDEPALISRRQLCQVVIDPKRTRAVEFIQEHLECDVIVCDDGMQHYALARDIEICVIDKRGVGNGYLLPMGPLRESRERLNTVDYIIENQGTRAIEDFAEPEVTPWLSSQFSIKAFAVNLIPLAWVNVSNNQSKSMSEFLEMLNKQTLPISAVAGIGEPKRFFNTLDSLGIRCNRKVGLPDHFNFNVQDIPKNECVLMTEKDAVKCADFAHENCWFLLIGTNLNKDMLLSITQAIESKVNPN